jgi:Uma2 family endonuclease
MGLKVDDQLISIEDYLEGELVSDIKHEYLTIPSLKVYLIIDPAKPSVKVDRRRERGGFDRESYHDLAEVIPLPEIESELALADIYSGISLPEKTAD